MNLFNLIATLTLDSSQYKAGMKDARTDVNKTEKTSDAANKKMGRSFLKLAAIVAALVAVFAKLMKSTASYGSTVTKSAASLGVSTEAYQELLGVMKLMGGSADDLDSAMSGLNDTVKKASEGDADATAALAELGLTYSDFAGMSNEEIFNTIVTALQGMTDGTDKATLAQTIFGDSSDALTSIISSTSSSMADMTQTAKDMGLTMSEDDVKASNALQTSINLLKGQFEGIALEVGTALLPIFQGLADALSALMKWVNENKAAAAAILVALNAAIIAITVSLAALDSIPIVAAIGIIIVAVAALVTGIMELVKNWDQVEAYFTEQYNSGWLHWMKVAVEAVKSWFQSLVDFFQNLGSNITNIFSKIWDGLTAGFKAFCNFFIDGMNGLISGLNKISFTLPDWMGGAHFGIDIPLIPRLQKGEDFVPNDFYPAYLDYGERVLTRKENEKYSALGGVDGMETLVNGIGGAVSGKSSVRSSGDVKVYVQIGDKQFKDYVYKTVDSSMKQKGYKSLRKVGGYND